MSILDGTPPKHLNSFNSMTGISTGRDGSHRGVPAEHLYCSNIHDEDEDMNDPIINEEPNLDLKDITSMGWEQYDPNAIKSNLGGNNRTLDESHTAFLIRCFDVNSSGTFWEAKDVLYEARFNMHLRHKFGRSKRRMLAKLAVLQTVISVTIIGAIYEEGVIDSWPMAVSCSNFTPTISTVHVSNESSFINKHTVIHEIRFLVNPDVYYIISFNNGFFNVSCERLRVNAFIRETTLFFSNDLLLILSLGCFVNLDIYKYKKDV
ncbi:hypothetical protein K501DRAFT_300435 [Backusella circina FSU 941]|nr:hypothetical protein K501DRAFT_300435 [Backusella circina FSU 941]